MALASLVLGIISVPTCGCVGVGALAAIVLGILALSRANRDPRAYGGTGLAIGGIAAAAVSLLLAIPLGGIVAAIAIPSFLRARISANEASAIGDVRTVISAEAAYQSHSGGYYGPPECLMRPADCIPGYGGPPLAESPLFGEKSGYRRTFHAGPAVDQALDGSTVPPKALSAFAYTAVPIDRGRTGVRGFCGDSSARICFTSDGSEPSVANGACDPGCPDLR
jgi:hypothetical protein